MFNQEGSKELKMDLLNHVTLTWNQNVNTLCLQLVKIS